MERYLNDNDWFTIILTDGRGFRSGSFWLDNRYAAPFFGCDTDIIPDWNNVRLMRESLADGLDPGELTVLQRVGQYLNGQDHSYVIEDDDANEVADYVFLSETKFILIHAKASETPDPRLRVGNLHIVTSQALKNLRYFIPDNCSERELERLHTRSGTVERWMNSKRDSLSACDTEECSVSAG